ncbi:aminotransferase class I/II-fold pyridoxal phosphate-dependent enzyme [Sporomusa malonica]|uniref:DNA-binding transcriptional regulator, MocR family, contains an aminotransferase domain n=1 Tax=Sporomusa malonica TaxID=112901 RepID=A0A1W1Y9K6_9FIRM|nr:aminotransferase class I/II-fold pyridoxal phosphate-dependent enzyme [Sporomusa malonica]SMC32521.1 DNA-binding transcriptional regulator, MocR family, contains an aminotransferase domain [Sporomusa malonica]
MTELEKMNDQMLQEHYSALVHRYEEFQAQKLKLNMSRGIPSLDQLNLASGLLDCLTQTDYKAADGTDCRNYGGVDGIPEAKQLFSQVLEASPNEIIIGGNSSLSLMYDLIARAMLLGLPDSETPWVKLPQVKFLCPSPGYDRHFAICEHLGIEMIPINYQHDGPDMTQVEQLVAADSSIKGIWCVPKHSNPTGITYSDAVVKRLAAMPVKAPDFRIFWDNAYTVHHLTDTPPRLLNILDECKQAGNPDRVLVFGSTSKVSFAGSGIAVLASSETNISWFKKHLSIQTIGPDKLNQLRHVRFFNDLAGIEAHMRKHAAIIKPKFDLAIAIMETELGGQNLASWSKPQGGYFISVNTLPGCAKKIVAKTAAAGVVLTPAGATFPYGKDPKDNNIRLAPTFPPLAELKQAMELFTLCIQLISVEQELEKRAL